MKNTLVDLQNHLFASLERLGDETIKVIDVDREKAISGTANSIIAGAKLQLEYMRLVDSRGSLTKEDFFEQKSISETRPQKQTPAQISWNKHDPNAPMQANFGKHNPNFAQ